MRREVEAWTLQSRWQHRKSTSRKHRCWWERSEKATEQRQHLSYRMVGATEKRRIYDLKLRYVEKTSHPKGMLANFFFFFLTKFSQKVKTVWMSVSPRAYAALGSGWFLFFFFLLNCFAQTTKTGTFNHVQLMWCMQEVSDVYGHAALRYLVIQF